MLLNDALKKAGFDFLTDFVETPFSEKGIEDLTKDELASLVEELWPGYHIMDNNRTYRYPIGERLFGYEASSDNIRVVYNFLMNNSNIPLDDVFSELFVLNSYLHYPAYLTKEDLLKDYPASEIFDRLLKRVKD